MADVTAEERRTFASRGWAMPDGSYFIRPDHPEDLGNAIQAVGRATATGTPRATDEAQRNAVRRHIMKRARALGRSGEIPDTWNSDGTLKQAAFDVEEFLAHYGVPGMRWGVRRSHPGVPPSHDAATAAKLKVRVAKAGGTQTLTNAELKALVTRMNLEQQYSGLSQVKVNAGRKMVNDVLLNVAKQEAQAYALKGAEAGIKALIKVASKK